MAKKSLKIITISAIFALFITACTPATPSVTETDTSNDSHTTTETTISYYGTLKKLDSESIMDVAQEEILNAYFGEYIPDKIELYETWDRLMEMAEWYEVGEIQGESSPFDGYKYVIWNNICEGPCFSADIHRFAMNPTNNELTLFPNYSSEYLPNYSTLIAPNSSDTTINNAILPDQITITSHNITLTKGQADIMFRANGFENDTYQAIFESEKVGTVYQVKDTNSGCFYVLANDGSVSRYDLDPGFFAEGADFTIQTTTKTINFSKDYSYSLRGCGTMGNCYSFEQDMKISDLTEFGQDQNGNKFYIVNMDTESSAKEMNSSFYDSYKGYIEASSEYNDTMAGPLSFEEFLNTPAILYWQDPLDRWVGFMHNDFTLPAECGKPVIYLYPETTTDISVQVDVDKFTVTVPEYGENGWLVRATPKSELFNYADNQTYPYLFWEAIDYDSTSIDSGFMIARQDIPTFLDESLDKLGLNTQEKTDFIEFWEPRILANSESYFFISFLGTNDFNKIAPLNISPKPDSLIRVFMFYAPSDKFFAVRPQELSSASRYGFTVLEWGGTSTKPWAKE